MNLSKYLLFNSHPLVSLWRNQVSWQSHQSIACSSESVLPALENKSPGPTLSSQICWVIYLEHSIQSQAAVTHSVNNKILFELPSILTCSITHFNFLHSWSLQSSVHFSVTDLEDKPHPSYFHPCSPATTRSASPWGHPISWTLISLLFYVSPNLINSPSFSAFTNPLTFYTFPAVPSEVPLLS